MTTAIDIHANKDWLGDIDEEFMSAFARRNIIGGSKGARHRRVETDSDWIVHARYLLSIMKTEHVEQMLSVSVNDWSWHTPCAGAWIASLLKDTRFIEQIGELAVTGGNMYFTCAFFASLLLFDDPLVSRFYLRVLDNKEPANVVNDYEDSTPLALYCLELLDKRCGSTYAAQYISTRTIDPRMRQLAEKLVERILRWSQILRAGIVSKTPEELQERLKALLEDATTTDEYMRGLLYYRPVRHIIPELWEQFRSNRHKFHDDCITEYKATGTIRNAGKSPFFSSSHAITFPPDKSKKASAAARSFLAVRVCGDSLKHMQAAVAETENFVDIFRIIDLDVHNQLPSDVIISCFEKLLNLIPHSFDLYEQYSVALLLRGTEHDAFAKELWEKAQTIKNRYEYVQEDHCQYVMFPPNN